MTNTPGLLQRFRIGLTKTRDALTSRLKSVFEGARDVTLDQFTATLLGADLGVSLTERLIASLKEEITRQDANYNTCKDKLKQEMRAILSNTIRTRPNENNRDFTEPIWPVGSTLAFFGVNGVGKTTTIGKMAYRLTHGGKTVLLAAGDTFRAGAIEQLSIWGKRAGADLICSTPGADPSAVVFDAIKAATARKSDYLLIDTAGRLQTNQNLMGELKKITRVIAKALSDRPYERILVLDAVTGQNAVSQAKQFHEAVGITGVVLTKLDGSAKGGMLISVVETLRVPVLYVGLGEGIEDLVPFCIDDYLDAIFEEPSE